MFTTILPFWYAVILTAGLFSVEKREFPPPPAQPTKTIAPLVPYGKSEGKWGAVTIGPSLGLGIPHVINVGLESQYRNLFGLAANYGIIPGISVQKTTVSMSSYDVRARWFPLRRSFFLGVAYGVQNLIAETSQQIQGIPVDAHVTVSTTYISPHLGWRWQWPSGFFTGMDLGVQISCATSTTITTNIDNPYVTASDDYQKIVKQVSDQGNDLGRTRLPFATLFEIGYLF